MPRSIRGRMTVAAVSVFAVILLIGSVAIALTVPAWVRAQLTDRADRASRQVTTLIDTDPIVGAIPPQSDVLLLQVVDDTGEVVAASAALRGRPPMTEAKPKDGDSRVAVRVCPPYAESCLIVVGTSNRATAYGPAMAYAAVRENAVLDSPVLLLSLIAVSLVLLALVGWGAWILVGRVLAPVERIRSGLEQISATDLSERMPVPDTGDEVAELAVTVNDTLSRLEDAVDRHRRFVSDASHELRTPLTAMLIRLEAGVAHPDEDTVKGALDDANRLSAIVQDLLLMARLDAGVRPPDEVIDLGELVAEELDRRPSRLPVDLEAEPGVRVLGNRLRLSRVLTNLLSNADRYGESRVGVAVTVDGDRAVVEVSDDGPGIPEDMREQIFQRFTRLDRGRSRDTGGSGLGLPIARDIATAHDGTLHVADAPGGARMILRLPLHT
ncbi:ATP-binding protein [Nonomuraea sp. NPDC050556]|uniref:sensor histidine kinase n=1 Tax=Nonomuraea sp. NPDC050556 TaxID=3364369 RepID=UPI00379FA793